MVYEPYLCASSWLPRRKSIQLNGIFRVRDFFRCNSRCSFAISALKAIGADEMTTVRASEASLEQPATRTGDLTSHKSISTMASLLKKFPQAYSIRRIQTVSIGQKCSSLTLLLSIKSDIVIYCPLRYVHVAVIKCRTWNNVIILRAT